MNGNQGKLTRIAVFYDGNYFQHISNYYAYHHERRARISVAGLHSFIRHKVAEEENTLFHLNSIVDAHYFRGRLSAQEVSNEGNRLYFERLFDDILMMEGVTTHYLPVRYIQGYRQERGIDVWLALEALELAISKRYDVICLVASDGDYVPLVRKLNTLGTRVMVLGWDFEYYDEEGGRRSTVTSQALLEVTNYPIPMHNIIDGNGHVETSFVVDQLFVERKKQPQPAGGKGGFVIEDEVEGEVKTSTIFALKDGYGFINYPLTNNLFFHYSFLVDTDFNDLHEGDLVEFTIGRNERGEPVARNVRLLRTTES
ncbi:MAG: NYN domain-containing protein [Saprospiraceae bacterium]|nr:NYN domain-containing protein [Saprospiraceae bacterium]